MSSWSFTSHACRHCRGTILRAGPVFCCSICRQETTGSPDALRLRDHRAGARKAAISRLQVHHEPCPQPVMSGARDHRLRHGRAGGRLERIIVKPLRTFPGGWSEVVGKPGVVRRREGDAWHWSRVEEHELGDAAEPLIKAMEARLAPFELREALAAAVRQGKVQPNVDALSVYAARKLGLSPLAASEHVEAFLTSLRSRLERAHVSSRIVT